MVFNFIDFMLDNKLLQMRIKLENTLNKTFQQELLQPLKLMVDLTLLLQDCKMKSLI